MTRLPVSSLLLGTLGATLALTFACSGGDDKKANNGGTSGAGPSAGGAAAMGGGGTTSGSAGQGMNGGSSGSGTMNGGTGGSLPNNGGSAGTPMGGTAGSTGAAAGMGGSVNPTGGTAGSGMAGSGGGFTTCNITAPATQSTGIQTVFTVEVTADLPGASDGYIEFGLDTSYGYKAPLDWAAANHKTAMLGMKQNTDYHYRAVVTAGDMKCATADATITTGPLYNGFPTMTVTPKMATGLSGDFMIAEFYAGMRQMPFILDKDRDMVWAWDPKFDDGGNRCCDTTRARMSMDGKYMWVAHGNVPSKQGLMKKIAMDGSGDMDMSPKFQRMNHDFTIVDDANQTMYFIAYKDDAGSGCDDIVEYDPVTDMNRTVTNLSTIFTDGMACHANAIQYSPQDDTLMISELDRSAYVKIDRKTGAKKWILGGGSANEFTGDGATWQKEHNFHLLEPDHFVFFNNGPGMGTNSQAIELKLDEAGKTATKKWNYAPTGNNLANAIMGDVQRLANGNTLVAFSTLGIIHEVDAAGTKLQEISWSASGAIGYIIMRPTLYGKPPR